MEHTFLSAETVKGAMKMANKGHIRSPTGVLPALMWSLAEIRVNESELFQSTAKPPIMKVWTHVQKFVVFLILPQRMKARTMQRTWWTVVLQSYDITWAFLQAIQHIAHQLMEVLSSHTLECEVMTMDCWKWKHRGYAFFCPGKLIIFKVLTHFHAVNIQEIKPRRVWKCERNNKCIKNFDLKTSRERATWKMYA
jgi:hypothetical protein